MKINNTLIKNLFYKTLRIRSVELEISKRYAEKNEMPNHLSVGQESVAVGVCENLKMIQYLVLTDLMHIILLKVEI